MPVGEGAIRVTTGDEADIGSLGRWGRPGGEDARPDEEGSAALIARRAGLPSPGRLLGAVAGALEAQYGRAFLWAPVAFGIGSATYLGLKTEPPLWPLALAAVAAVIAALAARRWSPSRGLVIAAALLATVACGLADGALHTRIAAAPVVPAGLGVTSIDGWVVDVANPSDSGGRLLIAPVEIGGLSPEATPKRVRIVVPQGAVYGPGSAIHVAALLDPPPGPAAPGAYDFARDAWFEGVGGVGLAMKPPQLVDLEPPPLRLRLVMAIAAARWSLAERLADRMSALMGPNDSGAAGLAVAVATSHQDWLDPQARDDLRGSGLAHMLAIAGLHMAAVSGFAFAALRLAVAAWPWLALRVSGKKIAAAGGLLAVVIYLVLSGAHPPARRAAITAGVAFLAMLFDRRVVSLHSLALAALVILVLQPEVVVAPGFEMSFCATAALVALAELWPHRPRAEGLPWGLAALQGARDWTLAMLMVSLVAGAATAPFSIQHFNRVANYGVFANLTADLLASVVLMPGLALGVLFQSLGLSPMISDPPLAAAGWAARAIVSLAHLFANAPGAAVTLPSAPQAALAISYLGVVFACLWKGRLRWIGLPLAFAVAVWPRPAAPVAWIASDGDDAAIVSSGQEIALKPGRRVYATTLLAQRWALRLPADPAAAQAALFDCDRKACLPKAGASPGLAAWWSRRAPKPDEAAALCGESDIVVWRATAPPPEACGRALVLDEDAFVRGGAAEVYPGRDGRGYRLRWSQPIRGDRPWSRVPGEAATDSGG
jgi:competence protein ComEC